MKKWNIDMQVSEKDKKILIIFFAFAILACAYFFGYQNLMNMTDKYKQQGHILSLKEADLNQKNGNRERYISDIEKNKNTYNVVLSSYANGASQDSSLDFLTKIEMITGSWIKSSTFSETAMIYTFGNISSSNPAKSGIKVYSTDMKGLKTTLTLTYEAKYDDWKKLINYINNYISKNTIDSISMTYNEVTGVISGTMSLSTYAISGAQRSFTAPKFNLPVGTANIFSSSLFDSSSISMMDLNGEYILSDYDSFILLNSSTSDVNSCIIGKKDDTAKESIISSNSNDFEHVTVRVAGTNGKYTIQYKIGNTTYPATNYDNGSSLAIGNTLDLLIMSSARVSNTDKSGINLNLINDTDMALNVKICNDDMQNPRVKFESKTGNINFYK